MSGAGKLDLGKLGGAKKALEAPAQGESIVKIDVTKIMVGKYQPRKTFDEKALKELAESIKAQGVMSPVILRKTGDMYELIAGERRWRATQLAGLKTIPAVVREIADNQAIAIALIENVQRENLPPLEEALALKRLQDEFGLKNKEVAELISKSEDVVSKLLGLLKMPNDLQILVEVGKASVEVVTELSRFSKKHEAAVSDFLEENQGSDITLKMVRELKSSLTAPVVEPAKIPSTGFSDDSNQNESPRVITVEDLPEFPSTGFSGEKDDGSEPQEPETKAGKGIPKTKPNSERGTIDEDEYSAGGGEDTGGLSSFPRGKAISDPNRLKKPLLFVVHDERLAVMILNKRPTTEFHVFIKYEDNMEEKEVAASELTVNALREE